MAAMSKIMHDAYSKIEFSSGNEKLKNYRVNDI
jgi:hypothetical protein